MGNTVKLAAYCGLMLAAVACGKSGGSSDEPAPETTGAPPAAAVCPEARTADCDKARDRIKELEVERDAALAAKDYEKLSRVSLALNYQTELLRLFATVDVNDDHLKALDDKYKALGDILEQELLLRSQTPAPAPGPGPDDTRVPIPNLPTVVYHKLEIEALAEVTKDFGDLYIAETGLLPDGKPKYEEFQIARPWSGYWYALKDKSLFEGENAPLVKLDRLAVARGMALPRAAELEHGVFDMAEDSWEGRCYAWSIASAVSKEPTAPIVVDGVTFDVADQKGLLTKMHEFYPVKDYGIRYNGDATTDGTIQDIRPEAFHRIVLTQLLEKKQSFIIDDKAGIELWSKPVYRMRWSVQKDPAKANAYLVHALPWLIRERKELATAAAPTTDADRGAPEFTYRLYVDPATVMDGKVKVIAGEWIGKSLDSHPDTIVVPEPNGTAKSANEGINKAMDIARQATGLGG